MSSLKIDKRPLSLCIGDEVLNGYNRSKAPDNDSKLTKNQTIKNTFPKSLNQYLLLLLVDFKTRCTSLQNDLPVTIC